MPLSLQSVAMCHMALRVRWCVVLNAASARVVSSECHALFAGAYWPQVVVEQIAMHEAVGYT